MIVTGIGSRKIDDILYNRCFDLAKSFAKMGWHLRSGGARGADTAWEKGFDGSDQKTIYLPEPNFNGRPNAGCYKVPDMSSPIWFEAIEIARKVHARFDALDEFGQNAHTRNVFQVLGDDLKTKADLVIACAEPKGRSVRGGTATAFNLAKALRIPTFNLWLTHDQRELYKIYAQELLDNDTTINPINPITGRDLFVSCTDSPE